MKPSESGEEKATRQCWECLKRRLVCDHTLPHCKKCQKAGKDCPGYSETKPLSWVPTGKVTSRRRKNNSSPKVYTASLPERGHLSPKSNQSCQKGGQGSQETEQGPYPTPLPTALLDDVNLDLDLTGWKPVDEPDWASFSSWDDQSVLEFSSTQARHLQVLDKVFALGGRTKIEEVVSKRLHDEAAKMVGPKKEPLKRLESLLYLMRLQDLPAYDYLSNETSEVVQAVNYCKPLFSFVG